MLSFLPGPLVALIAMTLYLSFVMSIALLIFLLALLWLIIPIPACRRALHQAMNNIPSLWSTSIRFTTWLMTRTQWQINGLERLDKKTSYLLISNHQSWLDVLVMQRIFDNYAPQLRYFMKSQLIWVPFIGQACWALGYPFMKRYTEAYLKKHPEDRGKDLETTQKACEHFRRMPVTLINYVEGTRFRPEKHRKQQSPYRYLLKPKAGGVAFILSAMHEQMNMILNVTLVYSSHPHVIWRFLQGKTRKVVVNIELIPITPNLIGDYQHDVEFRANFQTWVNELWQKKDAEITLIREQLRKH